MSEVALGGLDEGLADIMAQNGLAGFAHSMFSELACGDRRC